MGLILHSKWTTGMLCIRHCMSKIWQWRSGTQLRRPMWPRDECLLQAALCIAPCQYGWLLRSRQQLVLLLTVVMVRRPPCFDLP